MKKTILSIVIFCIFLALAIVVILTSNSHEKKAPKMPTIKPKTITTKSSKFMIGEITVSYKYLHEPPHDHVDVAIIFATNKTAKTTVSYGEGLDADLRASEIHKKWAKEHYIVVHEVEPATNFTYQITAVSSDGKTVKSERLAFLTPPRKKADHDEDGMFSKILATVKLLFGSEQD